MINSFCIQNRVAAKILDGPCGDVDDDIPDISWAELIVPATVVVLPFRSVFRIGKDKGLVGLDPVSVDLVESPNLGRSEAGELVAGRIAKQGLWMEITSVSSTNDLVQYSIRTVALAYHFRLDG
jgi:hypothetical protein